MFAHRAGYYNYGTGCSDGLGSEIAAADTDASDDGPIRGACGAFHIMHPCMPSLLVVSSCHA